MTPEASEAVVPCSRRDIVAYFLRLGTTGFGGPIALAGYMQRDLVERRAWFTKQEFLDGLALAQLSPGPLAAQLAMYLGWARGGASGAAVVGAAFVLPSFLMVVALAALYVRFGGLAWVHAAFYGIGAAVIAIIGRSTMKLAKMTLSKDRLHWALFAISLVVTAVTESEIVWLFLASGAVAWIVRVRPNIAASAFGVIPPIFLTGLHGPATGNVLGQLALFFTKACGVAKVWRRSSGKSGGSNLLGGRVFVKSDRARAGR